MTTVMTPSRAALSACRILVVGDAMLDRYWFGDVDRVSPEAPVPVVRIRRSEERLGGAANVALNVVCVGAHAGLLTVLGDDEPGRTIARLAAQAGIEAQPRVDPQSSHHREAASDRRASSRCCVSILKMRRKRKRLLRCCRHSARWYRSTISCFCPTTAKAGLLISVR